MGMKSKSAHFPSRGQGGSGGRVSGNGGPGSGSGIRPSFPKKDGQIKHMFRKGKGHLTDTPANRNALASVASDEHNYVGTDKHGNRWYAKTVDGKQFWVKVRNGMVTDCGMNDEPRNVKDLFDRKDTNKK